MKTASMQTRLEELYQAGRIESGKAYDLMPSDCSGDGYDIALNPRKDESGDYEVAGCLMRVICTVRVGSRNWSDGIPAGYRLEVDPVAPYSLKPGEKAIVVHRAGNKIGSGGHMHRVMASIAIVSEALKAKRGKWSTGYVYRGHSPYWLGSTSIYAAHWRSGLSRADAAAYNLECDRLEAIAAQINAGAEIARKAA